MKAGLRFLHTTVFDYLSDGVSLMIADTQRVVVTPQSQQILGAPTATGNLLAMFAYQVRREGDRESILQNRLKTIKPSKIIYTVVLCVTQHRDLA